MTSATPIASIVVPAYNCERYIGECLTSLQGQGFRDFEVVVVDDGSTDGTAEVVDSFAASDSRFKLIRTENHGVSHARNVALDQVTGDYVLFVDADDWVAPDYVETLVRPLVSGECGCSSCGIAGVSDGGVPCFTCGETIEYVGSKAQVSMLDKPRGFLCNKGFLASVITQNGLRLDEGVAQSEDMLFLLDYLSLCDKLVYDSGVKYCYRQRRGSATNSTCNPRWLDAIKVFDAYRQHLSKGAYYRKVVADNFILMGYEAVYRAEKCGAGAEVLAAARRMSRWCEENAGKTTVVARVKRLTYKHAMPLVMAVRERGLR